MRWLDRLERIFGGWTIPNFPLFIVMATAAIYFLNQAQPTFVYRLLLEPDAVRSGELWRLFTFLFVPPSTMSLLWMILWLYVMFLYANALEQEWGEFKFLVFYGVGALATVAAAMIFDVPLGNMALYTTLFLAFATLFPEAELLLFFVLPVKVKYLGWLVWAIMVWTLIRGGFDTRVGIAASLLNYALFFGPELIRSWRRR